jgi:hypothetical protein
LYLLTSRRIFRPFILPNANKPRKPQTNPLILTHTPNTSHIPWTQTQIRTKHLPHKLGFKPHTRLLPTGWVRIIRLFGSDNVRFEILGVGIEDLVGEPGSEFTDCLVFLGLGVVAGEEVGAVLGGAFSAAVEGSHDD